MKFKPIQSVQRCLSILEYVAKSVDGVSLKEIAEVAGCSSPAAFHLAQTLVEAGYLEKLDTPKVYVIGQSVFKLSDGLRNNKFSSILMRELKNSQRRFPGVTVYYCEKKGEDVFVRAQILGERPDYIQENLQSPLAVYSSLATLVHVAFCSEEERERYMSRYPFDDYGMSVFKSRENYDKYIEDLRENGFNNKPIKDSFHWVGIPVFQVGGALRGSLTIGYKGNAVKDEKTISDKLHEVGREISEALSQA